MSIKTEYEKYVKRRAELIKEGKSISVATNQAYTDIYYQRKEITGEDLLSLANQ